MTKCKMPNCTEQAETLGACRRHWEWFNGSNAQLEAEKRENSNRADGLGAGSAAIAAWNTREGQTP